MQTEVEFKVSVFRAVSRLGAVVLEMTQRLGALCEVYKKNSSNPPVMTFQIGDLDPADRERYEIECRLQSQSLWRHGQKRRLSTSCAALEAGEYAICLAGLDVCAREAVLVLTAFHLGLTPKSKEWLMAYAEGSRNLVLSRLILALDPEPEESVV